jgi:hypothetical protein
MLVVVWYTQVSPTVTGNGMEAGTTSEFDVALEVPPAPALAEEAGVAVDAEAALEAEESAASAVPLDVPTPLLTCGVAPLPAPPQPARARPARATVAALARTTRTGANLLRFGNTAPE